jgi:hypothetical protein
MRLNQMLLELPQGTETRVLPGAGAVHSILTSDFQVHVDLQPMLQELLGIGFRVLPLAPEVAARKGTPPL